MATFPVRPELATVSSVFVVAVAGPSFAAILRWLGVRRGLQVLAILGGFALVIEALALQTGFPYGHFVYHDRIGAKVLGIVPWTVAFAWTPLLLGSMTLASRLAQKPGLMVACSVAILLAIDMVLDPGAVAQAFWTYEHPGLYYGVPLSNFAGWMLSGAIASFAFHRLVAAKLAQGAPIPADVASSALLICTFWTSVCLWMHLMVPAALGVVLMATFGACILKGEPGREHKRPPL